MRICNFIIVFIIFTHTVQSQPETTNWFFGNHASLNFSSGSPVAVSGSNMNAIEGSSSISDSQGNLLFYTDGLSVWNRNHLLMQNGTGLMGSWTSTQTSLIVPFPGNSDNYYIFTTDGADNHGVNGLRYSIVDMTLDNGFGAVTTQNTLLYAPVTEKITAVKHANGNDIWVIAHANDTTLYLSFLVTSSGISSSPVISNIGNKYIYYSGAEGQLKASPDGNFLAAAVFLTDPTVELFEFDKISRIVSDCISLSPSLSLCYGIEFSPDSKKVYCASDDLAKSIYQYDIVIWDSISIANSQTPVGFSSSVRLCAMQLALDGKIYVAHNNWPAGGTYLGVINYPDSSGIACSYDDNGCYLGSMVCNFGLPNFIQSYFTNLSTGIPPNEETHSATISPNPSKGNFLIQSPYVMQDIEIISADGKMIFYSAPNKNALSVFIENNGVYFLKVLTENRQFVYRLVVTH